MGEGHIYVDAAIVLVSGSSAHEAGDTYVVIGMGYLLGSMIDAPVEATSVLSAMVRLLCSDVLVLCCVYVDGGKVREVGSSS